MNQISITSFSLSNDTEKDIIIIHEPECFEFLLPVNETISIEVASVPNAIEIKQHLEEDQMVIRILGDASLYRVVYKGEDAFQKYWD